MGLGKKKGADFQHHIQGTRGTFATPAGRVDYLLTKARLGDDDPDPERRLTQHLAPVREVLQPDDLDFSQLLQRDLDDHRVAVNLIPYLLKPNSTGPAFFPPIVAALLPFRDKRPSSFDQLVEVDGPVNASGLDWRQSDAGEQVRLRQLVNDDGTRHDVQLAEVWWNPEFARLVVLDGQHRAMALLAIDRTVRKSWAGGSGEKYRYFYESRVKDLLAKGQIDLERIEIPVAVIWFPEMFGNAGDPHIAARKLFVDVNKEARQPSESRLILLSDGELLNVFTRGLLSTLRGTDPDLLPLYSVEYDNPDPNSTQSARWSAVTNIHILRNMTNRLVFGPKKYLESVATPIGKREAPEARDALMREQLALSEPLRGNSIPKSYQENSATFRRHEIGNLNFPLGLKDELDARFLGSWGSVILKLLSGISPYAAHAAALRKVKDDWVTAGAVDQLAYDAMFSGVGMYWTLRDSAEHYRAENRVAKAVRAGAAGARVKPDIVKAWEVLNAKQDDFESQRASEYLGTAKAESVKAANIAYQSFNTQACQVGLAMAVGSLWVRKGSPATSLDGLAPFADEIVTAVNVWLASQNRGKYDRRLFLSKSGMQFPLNLISKLDGARAVEFRYFWLEVLASKEAADSLGAAVDQDVLYAIRDEARAHYFRFVRHQRQRELKSAHPEWSEDQLRKEANNWANKMLKSALAKWFATNWAGYSSTSTRPPIGSGSGVASSASPNPVETRQEADVDGYPESESSPDRWDLGSAEAGESESESESESGAEDEGAGHTVNDLLQSNWTDLD